MGYTTDFEGKFTLNKPLAPEHAAYLRAFSGTRRMKRDPIIAEKLIEADAIRTKVGLPIGPDAAYFIGSGSYGQNRDGSIIDYNRAPDGQPGLWCQWVPNEDGTAIEWDGDEKFYKYVPWLKYIIHHFLATWGYVLNGEVVWEGEESSDVGKIVVKDNDVRAVPDA